MKTLIAVSLLSLATLFPPLGLAAAHDHAGHGAATKNAPQKSALVDGLVRKVDKASARLTIAHGPLESLGMPAMTMAFSVKDPAMLRQVKVGDRIRFVADVDNGVLTVVRIEPVKAD